MVYSSRISAMGLLGGFGSRLYPLTACRDVTPQQLREAGMLSQSINLNNMPKPLSPLAGRPLMMPLLQNAITSCGIEDIGVALFYQGGDMRKFLGSNMEALRKGKGSSFYWDHQRQGGINLDTAGCLVRGWMENMRGTAGNYVVISGDIRANINMGEMLENHLANNALASIALAPVPYDQIYRFGAVEREGDVYSRDGNLSGYEGGLYSPVTRFSEKDPNAKSNLVNASIYIISERVFELIAGDIPINPSKYSGKGRNERIVNGAPYRLGVFSKILQEQGVIKPGEVNPQFKDWGKDIFPDMITHHPEIYATGSKADPHGFYGYLMEGLWADDGTLGSILNSNQQFLKGKGGFRGSQDFSWWPAVFSRTEQDSGGNIWLGKGAVIEDGACVRGPAYIGDNVVVRRGATVVNSVINGAPAGLSWHIGGGAIIESSVVWPDREALGLLSAQPALYYDFGGIHLINCILGGGFSRQGTDQTFTVDDQIRYSLFGTGEGIFIQNSVIVPNDKGVMVVRKLD